MSDSKYTDLTEAMVQRYSERLKTFGRTVQTLGWGSDEQQLYRFQQANVLLGSVAEGSLLDIGCGFGDYWRFLNDNGFESASYVGWDINPDLISQCEEAWAEDSRASFHVLNLAVDEVPLHPVADFGIMLGVLNLNFHGTPDNLEYSKFMIRQAFSAVKKSLVVDFLSTQHDPGYRPEDFVFYHQPSVILDFSLQLTPHVSMHHDYASIPQREFMVRLDKA